jgi:hypothetical protein
MLRDQLAAWLTFGLALLLLLLAVAGEQAGSLVPSALLAGLGLLALTVFLLVEGRLHHPR